MATRAEQAAWSAAAAERHPALARLHENHGPAVLGAAPRPADRFAALARAICFQQLSTAAGTTIWGRASALVAPDGGPVTPEAVLAVGTEPLRACGLSGAKTATILALADASARGDLDLPGIGRRTDADVVAHLTAVKGVGRWTAEMFLMFSLHRPDVWPVTDLGVRHGFAHAFDLDEPPTPKALDELGAAFAPHRSVVAWWCWREVDARRGRA